MKYTNDREIAINYLKNSLETNFPYIAVFIVAFLIGAGSSFLFVKGKKGGGIKRLFGKIYNSFKEKNIENIVFFAAILLVIFSIAMQCFDMLSRVSNTIINIFGTLVVSWLATKKTPKRNLKEESRRAQRNPGDI